jgi:predicted alpha-1,2-mannosidase
LLTLLYPHYQRDFARSLVAMTLDAGYLPRWPLGTGETGGMLGDSVDVVLADSWVKGIRDFDLRAAYPFMRANATMPAASGVPSGRGGILPYVSRGYVTLEAGGRSVSETLEYAYDDYALAVIADALGESADAAMFRMHSHNWQNLYDPTTQFLVGRHEDGTFAMLSNETSWQDFYAEGNAWQYNFFAPHDIDAMAATFGGAEALHARLDTMFRETQRRGTNTTIPLPYYWPGNEPCIHTPWIYAALDDGASAARWTHWIATSFYDDGPAGIPGNDDGGTMSAWYVFAALGVFPIAATPDYLIASPMLTHAEIALAGGQTIVLDAPDASARTYTPRTVQWNGVALTRPRIAHDAFVAGGTMRFELQ